MKVEWVVYGADPDTDIGWHVLGKSAGIGRTDEKLFIELCGTVPLPDPRKGHEKVYFGAARRRRFFLCQGEHLGKDRDGRAGAWVFRGFVLTSSLGVRAPYGLTQRLLAQLPAANSTDAIDANGLEVESVPTASADLVELFREQGRLVLVPVDNELDHAGRALDSVVGAVSGALPSYVLPAGKETSRFGIVGLTAETAARDGRVIPLARTDPSRRWWKRAVAALAALAALASGFGVWGCAAVQSSRRQREQDQQQLRQIEGHATRLNRKAATLRYMLTEQGAEFGQVLSSEPDKVESLTVKIGVTTYSFTRRDSAAVLHTLSGLLSDVDALRRTVDHGQPAGTGEGANRTQ